MTQFTKEMQDALKADGEKLRQMTGEDHGPHFVSDPPQQWFDCDACAGEGQVPTGRMSHSINSATVDPPLEIMKTCDKCNGAGGWLDDAESDPQL